MPSVYLNLILEDFPNLPWMKDGDLKITQSLAILKYIARRHNLANDKDAALAATSDMVEVKKKT